MSTSSFNTRRQANPGGYIGEALPPDKPRKRQTAPKAAIQYADDRITRPVVGSRWRELRMTFLAGVSWARRQAKRGAGK